MQQSNNDLKRVYIAHEYGGKQENLEKVEAIIRDIVLNQPDVIPVCQWYALVKSLNDSDEYERAMGMRATTALLRKGIIHELWIYGSKISRGVDDEIHYAVNNGITIFRKSTEITNEHLLDSFNRQGLPIPKIITVA